MAKRCVLGARRTPGGEQQKGLAVHVESFVLEDDVVTLAVGPQVGSLLDQLLVSDIGTCQRRQNRLAFRDEFVGFLRGLRNLRREVLVALSCYQPQLLGVALPRLVNKEPRPAGYRAPRLREDAASRIGLPRPQEGREMP